MVSFVGFQSELFLRLEEVRLEFLDLPSEHGLSGRSGVDAVGLDGNDIVTTHLQEVLGVDGHDSCLVGLRYVGKDAVHHAADHPVLVRVTGVLHDGDDVGPLLRHVHEVTARAVGEFHGIYHTLLANRKGNKS